MVVILTGEDEYGKEICLYKKETRQTEPIAKIVCRFLPNAGQNNSAVKIKPESQSSLVKEVLPTNIQNP